MRGFLEYLKVSLWMIPIILPAIWLLPRVSKRYAARVSYVIWLVLALRLLIPWNLTLPQETAPIHVALSQEQADWVQVHFPQVQPMTPQEEEMPQATPVVQAQTQTEREPLQPIQIAFALWAAGILFFALRTVGAVWQMKRLLRRWEAEPSAEMKAFFAETAGERRPRLLLCPILESPMAVGLLRTTVYLPHEQYDRQEMEMIFRHELIHWRRRDLWYKLVLLAARSVHWFNPLVWLMAKRAERDLEISCDSAAVEGRDAAYRKAYGRMILQEAERSIERRAALTTCFTDGKRVLQERLTEIMNQSRRRKGLLLVLFMLLLTITCGCFISCGKKEEAEVERSAGILTAEQRALAEQWAEALSLGDGKIRYAQMGKEAKAQFAEEQKAVQGEDWDYHIGSSSPWVTSYTIEEREKMPPCLPIHWRTAYRKPTPCRSF
nr:M56 family metallopeptidase [uncultured Anaerotignum sp.]